MARWTGKREKKKREKRGGPSFFSGSPETNASDAFERETERGKNQRKPPAISIANSYPFHHHPHPLNWAHISIHKANNMFASLRVSTTRSALSAVRVARVNAVRGFIAPTVSRRADFVQELYLKELKAYKPTPVKDSDSVGQVQTFSAPKAPKSPEEADLANSLKEYENMAVEVEGNEGASATSTSPSAAVEDWLVEEEEDEAPAKH
ncbi:ATP synthase complex subunit H-domain-containing protein [Xylaria sp. CBS 124048]|nr:ATP synthase complex subunit H-domain-containing protein [Xylaria sp. CBS 124048]